MALASMTLLTHGSSLLWALLCVWHTGGRGGSLLRALLCGVRGGKTAHRREKEGAHDFQHDSCLLWVATYSVCVCVLDTTTTVMAHGQVRD